MRRAASNVSTLAMSVSAEIFPESQLLGLARENGLNKHEAPHFRLGSDVGSRIKAVAITLRVLPDAGLEGCRFGCRIVFGPELFLRPEVACFAAEIASVEMLEKKKPQRRGYSGLLRVPLGGTYDEGGNTPPILNYRNLICFGSKVVLCWQQGSSSQRGVG